MNGPWVDGKTNQRDSCVILITQIFSVHNVSEMATKKHFCFANCSWRLGAFNSITIQQEYQVFRKVPLVTSEPVHLEAMISCNHPLSQFNVTCVMRRQYSLSWITLYAQLVGVSLRLEMLFEGLILELSLNVRTFCELVKYTSHLGLTVTCVKSNWFVSVILEYNMVTRQKFNVV